MRAFQFKTAASPRDAANSGTDTAFIAGGTNLIDLMKLGVVAPARLVDLGPLSFRGITVDGDGLHIGERVPGSGCPALEGENRMHAVFGVSDSCCATHPSDLAVALVALESVLKLQGPQGVREVKLEDFYLLPENTPDREHDIRQGEMITEIFVPHNAWTGRSGYLKIRDRESYEFALTSAAVALDLDGSTIRDARIAVGGVGTKPWSLPVVAEALKGKTANRDVFAVAAEHATEGARTLSQNGFKVPLVKKTIVRALSEVGGVA